MVHITSIQKRSCRSVFLLCLFITVLFPLCAHSSNTRLKKQTRAQVFDREYFVFLFGNVFFLLEIVDLTFSSDGTFSLSSDLFNQPAQGTYNQENAFVLKAEGTTGKFYDTDFKEDIEIQYQFNAHPLGLRDFFVTARGSRKFIFYKDGHSVSEKFIFFGSGF